MKVIEIGANSFEVQDGGKCLCVGSQADCESYIAHNAPKVEKKTTKKKPSKKKVNNA